MHERRLLEVLHLRAGQAEDARERPPLRYSQLLTRYNQLRELWGRKMREREEGPLDFRRRSALLNAPSKPPAPKPAPVQASPVTSRPNADPYVRVAPGTNGDDIQRLYRDIEKEHLRLGKMPNITIDS